MFAPVEIAMLFNHVRVTGGYSNDAVVEIAGIPMQATVLRVGGVGSPLGGGGGPRNIYTIRRVAYDSNGVLNPADENGRGWGIKFKMKNIDNSRWPLDSNWPGDDRPLPVIVLRPHKMSVINGLLRPYENLEGNEEHFTHDATLLRLFSTIWEEN